MPPCRRIGVGAGQLHGLCHQFGDVGHLRLVDPQRFCALPYLAIQRRCAVEVRIAALGNRNYGFQRRLIFLLIGRGNAEGIG